MSNSPNTLKEGYVISNNSNNMIDSNLLRTRVFVVNRFDEIVEGAFFHHKWAGAPEDRNVGHRRYRFIMEVVIVLLHEAINPSQYGYYDE